MELTIARHGPPKTEETGRINSGQMESWIEKYNNAPLSVGSIPPIELKNVVQHSNAVVCSDLRRSIDSAKLLGADKLALCSDQFREADLPYGNLAFFNLRASQWAFVFRSAWFFGYSTNSESVTEFRIRAMKAALYLAKLTKEQESVVLIGHYFLNKQVTKNLVKMGWSGSRYGSSHWGLSTYTLGRT